MSPVWEATSLLSDSWISEYFMEPEHLLPWTEEIATGRYPELDGGFTSGDRVHGTQGGGGSVVSRFDLDAVEQSNTSCLCQEPWPSSP
jgi:hypothetical protein